MVMLTCRDQQAATYKGSRKINRPATHSIHFVADSPDKIIATLRKRGPTPNPAHGSHLTVRTATACRALHNFTEELSNRQEVQ